MSDVDNGAGYAGMGSGDMGNLCTFSQFLCTLKTALKKTNLILFLKKRKDNKLHKNKFDHWEHRNEQCGEHYS